MWVDRRTVVLGTGVRCNREGARQVAEVLAAQGVTSIIPFPIPYGHAHVDGLMNLAAPDLAMIFPWQVPYDVWKALVDRGYRVLEAPSVDEVKHGSALNWVALEPGRVLMPAGNPRTREALEAVGVTVLEAEIPELRKGWGAIHCMTAFLRRDPV
jgi:N-dimethylarginine dimethylaminohydrolase